jgi:hypothetical protein
LLTFSRGYALFHYEIIVNKLKSCSHNKVTEILSNFVTVDSDCDLSVILNEMFESVYIIGIQSSPWLNDIEFEKNFRNLYEINPKNAGNRHIVAWFIRLFHESAHFLRRCKCQMFYEAKTKYTSKNKDDESKMLLI